MSAVFFEEQKGLGSGHDRGNLKEWRGLIAAIS
jgi:hypothetical protein